MTDLVIDLDYDARDKLFVDLLLEGYDNCYYCYQEDRRLYLKDPVKNSYKIQDITHNQAVLESYEILANHYSAESENVERRLQAIRDRINYKCRIVDGMSGRRPSLLK